MNKIIGKGQLCWPRDERISARYGLVTLTYENSEASVELALPNDGEYGMLSAKVVTPITSSHIGDIVRGLRQQAVPTEGVCSVLGIGAFIRDTNLYGVTSSECNRKTNARAIGSIRKCSTICTTPSSN